MAKVSLKKHFEALRAADQAALKLVSDWTRERLESHNGLLKQWRDASEKDRDSFARKETLDALAASFATYREITAKALDLAEGKSRGFGMSAGVIVQIISSIASIAAVLGVAIVLFK